jgi:hypothetical protein
MLKTGKTSALFLATTMLVAAVSHAKAADESFAVGGVLEDGFTALHQELSRQDNSIAETKLSLLQDGTPSSFGFTPRFSGVPIGLADGVSIDQGSVLKSRLAGAGANGQRDSKAMRYEQVHDLGMVKLDLSAIAGYANDADRDLGQSSTIGFGGGLKFQALEGLRFGASYNRRDESLGLVRDRVTAGLGYNFGAVDTRLSVSNVSQYDINGVPTDEQQVWVVGGQMQLSSSLVVGGDVAYSTSLDGTEDTSGVVNFRFNF